MVTNNNCIEEPIGYATIVGFRPTDWKGAVILICHIFLIKK